MNIKKQSMNSKMLTLGLPKGSLQEQTIELFRKAGYNIYTGSRSYFPSIDDNEIKVILVRAQEMARYVQEGVLDCGITGEDWILENGSDVARISELRYSKRTANSVRWVVAVKDDDNIKSIKDLEGKRISTELVNYSKKFFKKNKIKVNVEFSWGATEVKVHSGLADAIVELTETGESLRANHLKIIDTVCESTTKFIANHDAYKNAWKRKKIETILLLLRGALDARDKVGIKLNVEEKKLDAILALLPALKKPTISLLTVKGWLAVEVIIDENQVRQIVPLLKDAGAQGIIEYPLNKLIY